MDENPWPAETVATVNDRAEVVTLARQCTRYAIETLFRVMVDPEAARSTRVTAASALLDRGWGRPPQTVAIAYLDDPARLAELQTTLLALQNKRITFIDGSMVVEG